MSETNKPSAIGFSTGPEKSSGRTSLKPFSSGIPSTPRQHSFESVKSFSLPNKLSEPKKSFSAGNENKFPQRVRADSFSPFSSSEIAKLKQAPKGESSKALDQKSLTKNSEQKTAPKTAEEAKRGSERFTKLGPTEEHKINRPIDPLDKQVTKSEVGKTTKTVEGQPITHPENTVKNADNEERSPKAKNPESPLKTVALAKSESTPLAEKVIRKVTVTPEDITKIVPEIAARGTELAQPEIIDAQPLRGSSRYAQTSEVAARMSGLKSKTESKTTSAVIAESNSGSTQTKRSEIIANLVKNQKVGLVEITKIDQSVQAIPQELKALTDLKPAEFAAKIAKDIPAFQVLNEVQGASVTDQKNVLADLIKMSEKSTTTIPNATVQTEMQQTIQQQVGTGSQTEQNMAVDAIIQRIEQIPTTDLKSTVSLKTIEQNLQVGQQVLAEIGKQSEIKMPTKLVDQLITAPKIINFAEARAMIEQKSAQLSPERQPEILKSDSLDQAINELQQLKSEAVIPAEARLAKPTAERAGIQLTIAPSAENKVNLTDQIKNTELKPHIEAVIQIMENPEQVNIQSEKRAEAIELLKELSSTKEYATNPELQSHMKAVVKKEQERVIETSEVAVTAEKMIIAGLDQEVIAEQLQSVVENKKLPINDEQLQLILEQAEIRVTQGPKLIAENGLIIEEAEDEYQRMLRELQLLMIELDGNVLENRFKSVFQALEKTWITAVEQGWEQIEAVQIIENLPGYEPQNEKSPIAPETDGSRVEMIKELKSLGSFDNLDYARQAITNVLLNHLPGRVANQPQNQILTPKQVQEILQGGNYPSQMGRGNNIINFPQFAAQVVTIAA